MSRISVGLARLRGLFGKKRRERELDDELQFHLEMQEEANRQAGMDSREAAWAARRMFGAVQPVKEQYRDQGSIAALEILWRDARFAWRSLAKSPSYSVAAALVLALAMGASTAMYSVVDAVLLRPLPFPEPAKLVMLWTQVPSQSVREGRTAYGSIAEWRRHSQSFGAIAAFDPASATLTTDSGAGKVSTMRASPEFLALLGVRLLHGRAFTAREADERERVAVIGHRFWQSRFGGSREALGAFLTLDGVRCRVIGILPADFVFRDADMIEPHTAGADWETQRGATGSGSWFALGRLREGVTIGQAEEEMNALARNLDGHRNLGISVTPLDRHLTGGRQRLAVWMMAGAIVCVLLMAVSNVASLSLARAASRETEIAVRAALGGSPGRILRQLLVESLLLALLAGALGLTVTMAALRAIRAVEPDVLFRLNEVRFDWNVLAGALALCVVTGLLVGMAPAIVAARQNASAIVTRSARGVAGRMGAARLRRALVISEFALALMLLAGAGLLLRSLNSLGQAPLGFEPNGVLSVAVSATSLGGPAQRAEFYRRVLDEIRPLAGVSGVGVISNFFAAGSAERAVELNGGDTQRLRLRSDELSDGFLQTMGVPLVSGRFFSSADGAAGEAKALVNQAMARRLWPDRDPIGQRFQTGGSTFTVVGVVGDMRRQGLEADPIPQMFEPLAQNPPRLAAILIRTSLDDPMKLAAAVEQAVHRADRRVPVYGVNAVERQLAQSLAPRRFQTMVLVGFAAVALLMAAIGIHGLIQYSITARVREIGIRMAMGSSEGGILRLILGEGLMLSFAGLALGAAGALWLSRIGSSLLFGVSATDPVAFAGAALILTAASLAACYFPARRAMKLDPMTCLRQD